MNDVLARPLPPPRVRARVVVLAASLDVLVVILFAASGRSTHSSALNLTGIAATAWPFLIGLVAAWATLRAWRAPMRILPVGAGVWGVTWAIGVVLRALTGAGTAPAFVLVAFGVLLAGIVGWRILARFAPSMRSTYPGLSQH